MKYHDISAFSENYMYAPVAGQLQQDIGGEGEPDSHSERRKTNYFYP